jgi:hypothetical protein
MINFNDVKTPELLAIYNEAAKALGSRTVNKFSDKITAVKRTQAIVEEANKLEGFVAWMKARTAGTPVAPKAEARKSTPPPAPAAKVAKAAKAPRVKAAKKERRMSFQFKPLSKQKAPKGDGSLRTLCLAKLSEGAKFDAVIKLVEKFDAGRGKGNAETIERRAYELVRIMHYQLGYGIKHDETTGLIQVYN